MAKNKKGEELYSKILNFLEKDSLERGEDNKCVVSLTETEALELFTYTAPEDKDRVVKRVTVGNGKVNIYYTKDE